MYFRTRRLVTGHMISAVAVVCFATAGTAAPVLAIVTSPAANATAAAASTTHLTANTGQLPSGGCCAGPG